MQSESCTVSWFEGGAKGRSWGWEGAGGVRVRSASASAVNNEGAS